MRTQLGECYVCPATGETILWLSLEQAESQKPSFLGPQASSFGCINFLAEWIFGSTIPSVPCLWRQLNTSLLLHTI